MRAIALSYRSTDRALTEMYRPVGSTEMYTMHEALAREHMRQREREARQHRLVSELTRARRWHYLERRAHAAHRRHANRAARVAHYAITID